MNVWINIYIYTQSKTIITYIVTYMYYLCVHRYTGMYSRPKIVNFDEALQRHRILSTAVPIPRLWIGRRRQEQECRLPLSPSMRKSLRLRTAEEHGPLGILGG